MIPTATGSDPERSAADAARSRGTVRRSVHAGFALIGGSSRSGPGYGVNVALEQDAWIVETEVDWTNRDGAQRTVAVAGAGLAAPLGRSARVRVVALGGVDAGTPAYLLPTFGARVGVAWRRSGGGLGFVPGADVAVAALSAAGARVDREGARTRETAFVLSVRLGWDLPGS